MVHRDETPLAGEVRIDGCCTDRSVKPANHVAGRVDRRLAKYRNPDHRSGCWQGNARRPERLAA